MGGSQQGGSGARTESGPRAQSDCRGRVKDRIFEDLGAPEGFTIDEDTSYGIYVRSGDDISPIHDGLGNRLTEGEEAETYHLDEGEVARVCQYGWVSILDELTAAFTRRATLALARDWQAEMDALIAESDPWVTLADSLAAGNCKAQSASFAEQVARHLGPGDGPVGAARASVVLGLRDDAYARRACRVAAARYALAS
jgi:hypothetical protein